MSDLSQFASPAYADGFYSGEVRGRRPEYHAKGLPEHGNGERDPGDKHRIQREQATRVGPLPGRRKEDRREQPECHHLKHSFRLRVESVPHQGPCAVSAVEGREPGSLRPLEYVLDPDALAALSESRSNGHPRKGGCLSFVYSGCRVSIDNGDYLSIEPLESVRRASTDGESYSNGTC